MQPEVDGEGMKIYLVVLLQLMVWSGYTVMEWLSRHDEPIYNLAMFLVFSYISMIIAKGILLSLKKTMLVTTASLLFYGGVLALLDLLTASQFWQS